MTGMEGSSADSKETTRKPGRAGQDTPAAEERGGVPQQEGESTCKVRAKSMRRETGVYLNMFPLEDASQKGRNKHLAI